MLVPLAGDQMTEQILRAHSSCRAQRGGAAVILTDTNDLETRPFGSPARPTSRASGWGRQEAGSAGRSEYRGGLACVGATGEFRLPRGGGMRSSSLAHTRGGDSSSQEAHPQRPPLGALGFRGHAPASASQGLVFLSGSARPSFPRKLRSSRWLRPSVMLFGLLWHLCSSPRSLHHRAFPNLSPWALLALCSFWSWGGGKRRVSGRA